MGCGDSSAAKQPAYNYACTYCGQNFSTFEEADHHEKKLCVQRPQIKREDSGEDFVTSGAGNNGNNAGGNKQGAQVPPVSIEDVAGFERGLRSTQQLSDLIGLMRQTRAQLTTSSLRVSKPEVLAKVCDCLCLAVDIGRPFIEKELADYAQFFVASDSDEGISMAIFPQQHFAQGCFDQSSEPALLLNDAAEELKYKGDRGSFDKLKSACLEARKGNHTVEPEPQFGRITVQPPAGARPGTMFTCKPPSGELMQLMVPQQCQYGMEVSYPIPVPPQPGKESCLVVTKALCGILGSVDDSAPMPQTKESIKLLKTGQAVLKLHSRVVVRAGIRHAKQAMLFARQIGVSGLPELEAVTQSIQGTMRFPKWWDLSIMEGLSMEEVQNFTVERKDKTNLFGVQEVPQEELERIQKLFDASFVEKYTRDRKGGKVPNRLIVEKAQRVQNAQNWSEYTTRAEQIRREMEQLRKSGQPIMDSVDRLKTAVPEFSVDASLKVDSSVNAAWLFHGTTAGEAIAKTDFRIDLSGTNAGTLYGRGVYLAESCAKSDEYSNEDAQGLRQIVICRAALGSIYYCDDVNPRPDDLVRQCMSGKFHCVLGDREKIRGTFREFIVFDEDQVYPEFVVWYKRWYNHPGTE